MLKSFLISVSSCGEISYFQVIGFKSKKKTEVIYNEVKYTYLT